MREKLKSSSYRVYDKIGQDYDNFYRDVLVPQKNFELSKHNLTPTFYFADLTRVQAEVLLYGQENGVFLVRDSCYFKGYLTLSCVSNRKILHFLIAKNNDLMTIDYTNWFDSLNDLIMFYQLNRRSVLVSLTIGLSSHDLKTDSKLNIIKLNEIKIESLIGSGEFSNVFKGKLNGKLVAIKQFKKSIDSINASLREALIINSLNHINIIKLIGVTKQSKILVVTEFVTNGSLVEYLRSRGRLNIQTDELIEYSYETSCGFEYLELNGIIHRDLCASNVLLDENKSIKICDFGLAIRSGEKEIPPSKIRIKWTAPESLDGRTYTQKSDVWSFSIYLFELFSYGRLPFIGVSIEPIENFKNFLLDDNRPSQPETCPDEIYSLMKQCWNLEPALRPSFLHLKCSLAALINF